MGDVMLATKLVEQVLAFKTEPGLKGVFGIVDAGVNYFTVPATGFQSECAVLLEDEDLFLPLCDFTSCSQANHSGANDCYIDFGKHLSCWLLRTLE
jgi:hypothetical protein